MIVYHDFRIDYWTKPIKAAVDEAGKVVQEVDLT